MKRTLSLLLALALLLLPLSSAAQEAQSSLVTSGAQARAVKVPYETVKAACDAGVNYLDSLGVTRKKVLAELTAHEHDRYYLGTPYYGGDHQSPNGDPSYNGYAGFNCAGFPAYVLRKCGLDTTAAAKAMRAGNGQLMWGSGRPYDIFAGASNYFQLVKYAKLIAYAYPNKKALLSSGKAEKGDLLLRYYTNIFNRSDDYDNHLMFFWGDTPGEDKIWESNGPNSIGPITGNDKSTYILIKFAPEGYAGPAADAAPTAAPTPAPTPTPVPTVGGFTDVTSLDWFAEPVGYVKENGLMNGIRETLFAPRQTLTRAQLVTVLHRLAGSPSPQRRGHFSDVPAALWCAPAVDWAAEEGIVSGVGGGKFGPATPIRREDMAVIFYRFYRWHDGSLFLLEGEPAASGAFTPQNYPHLVLYLDSNLASSYAWDALDWCLAKGLMAGTSQVLISPRGTATRAQAAAVLMRLHRLLS